MKILKGNVYPVLKIKVIDLTIVQLQIVSDVSIVFSQFIEFVVADVSLKFSSEITILGKKLFERFCFFPLILIRKVPQIKILSIIL